jgi:hypothetical protein
MPTAGEVRQALQTIERALRPPAPMDYPPTASGARQLAKDFAEWIRTTGVPAMRALPVLRQALAQLERQPTPVNVTVTFPEVSAHRTSPRWDPMTGRVLRTQPTVPMLLQVRAALAQALGHPPRTSELIAALKAAAGCQRAAAYRSLGPPARWAPSRLIASTGFSRSLKPR